MAALKAVKKAKQTPVITADDIGLMAKEYAEVSAQIKVLDEKKKDLAKKIKEGAVAYGTVDDKGSSYLSTGGYVVGSVKKVSMSLDQAKGVEILEKKGLGDIIDVVEVKTINEKRLENALGEKRLTLKDVDSFTNRKESYQVSVKAEADMPAVEQGNLSMAASRK